MDPKVASELSLRIPHLALRVREHSARALFYAGARRGMAPGQQGACSAFWSPAWQGRGGQVCSPPHNPSATPRPCNNPTAMPCCTAFSAERLEALGAKVVYPGLSSHPQHALLQRLANPGAHGWSVAAAGRLLPPAGRSGGSLTHLLGHPGRRMAFTLHTALHAMVLAFAPPRSPSCRLWQRRHADG